VQGLQGLQGRQGTQGFQGLQGRQGGQGLQGLQGLSNQGIQGLQGIQGIQGPYGVQGVSGTSVRIVGSLVLTPGNEQTELNNPSNSWIPATNGDGVIDSSTGNLWVYTNGTWVNVGNVRGPQGIQGLQGSQGLGTQGLQGLSGAQGETYWVKNTVGLHTTSKVGIGTTNPTEQLTVMGSIGIGGSLIFNDSAGVSNVISAVGDDRLLQYIIVDCGSY
jgi:hypothetical protein